MRVARHASGNAFLRAADEALDDVRDNVAWATALRLGNRHPDGTYLATVHDEAGAVRATAVRTAGRPLLLGDAAGRGGSPTSEAAAPTEALAEDLASALPGLPGVNGPPAWARAFAEAWERRTGARARGGMRQRLLVARAVRAPAPGPGFARTGRDEDVPKIAAWVEAFHAEVGLHEGVDGSSVARRLVDSGALVVWELDTGEVVSVAAVVGRTPLDARIGLVYTPPEARGRGHASRLVASLTRTQLDGGCDSCSLFTDAGNPVSNRIYERLGYRWVADRLQLRFERAD